MSAPSDPLERGRSVALHAALTWIAIPLGAGVIALLSLLTAAAALATLGAFAAIGSGELVQVLTAVPAILAISVLFPGVMVLPTATLVSALGIVIARSAHGARVPRRAALATAATCGAIYSIVIQGWHAARAHGSRVDLGGGDRARRRRRRSRQLRSRSQAGELARWATSVRNTGLPNGLEGTGPLTSAPSSPKPVRSTYAGLARSMTKSDRQA